MSNRRLPRALVTAAVASGLTMTGMAVAYAASPSPTSNPSPSASPTTAATQPGLPSGPGRAGEGGPGRPQGPRGGGPAGDADGVVTAVSSSTLTVRDEFGHTRTYTVTSSTTVHQGPRTQKSIGDIGPGDRVHVRGEKASNGSLQADDIDRRLAHIDGIVKSVSGSTYTVTDRDGFTRTIEVGSSTQYGDSGRAALVAGAPVHAEGTVNSDGTTLDATLLEVRRQPDTAPTDARRAPVAAPSAAPSGAPSSAPNSSAPPVNGS